MLIPVVAGLDNLVLDSVDHLGEYFDCILMWWVWHVKVQLFLRRFDTSCVRRSRLVASTPIALTHLTRSDNRDGQRSVLQLLICVDRF